MRNFEKIKSELNLKKFLESDLGTLYFIPYSPGSKRIIVRHFNHDNASKNFAAYLELMKAIKEWLKLFPGIDELVRVEQPLEIGTDFISRPHHTYMTSLISYDTDEDPPDPPEELFKMREAMRNIVGKSKKQKDKIIEDVMIRSILKSTAKTYFNGNEGKFIIVEPKFLPEDLENWALVTT